MASVTLERISCAFRVNRQTVWAVQDLSLDVADGEYVVLVGPSGCGKTTTLRLIAGLEVPAAGSVRIGSRRVNDVAPKDRDVAMVFQNYALYPHMTVFKNLAFGLKMRRTPKAEIRRRVDLVAGRLQITAMLDRRPAALSGGEKQRVALGRAIVRQPQVFLFDEPLSNLDASLRLRTRSDLKTLHRELGTTILHVTHDQEEAMTLGDRIAVLRHGKLQQFAAPLEVYRRPLNRFVAEFVGAPPMNFVPGRLDPIDGAIAFVGPFGPLPLPASMAQTLHPHVHQPVVLGLRPQHVSINDGPSQPIGEHAALRNCEVRLVEPLGDSVNVHAESGDGTVLVAKGPAGFPLRAPRVDLRLDLANAHFFAADDEGRRLN